jgi:hypothetical protein
MTSAQLLYYLVYCSSWFVVVDLLDNNNHAESLLLGSTRPRASVLIDRGTARQHDISSSPGATRLLIGQYED